MPVINTAIRMILVMIDVDGNGVAPGVRSSVFTLSSPTKMRELTIVWQQVL